MSKNVEIVTKWKQFVIDKTDWTILDDLLKENEKNPFPLYGSNSTSFNYTGWVCTTSKPLIFIHHVNGVVHAEGHPAVVSEDRLANRRHSRLYSEIENGMFSTAIKHRSNDGNVYIDYEFDSEYDPYHSLLYPFEFSTDKMDYRVDTWYINGHAVDGKEYLDWLDEMGIDINNISDMDKTLINLKWEL